MSPDTPGAFAWGRNPRGFDYPVGRIRDWLWRENTPTQTREITVPARDPGTSASPATPSTALAIPTVYRCNVLLAHTLQQLTPQRQDRRSELPRWLAHPERYGSPWGLPQLIGYWTVSLGLHGNMYAWARKTDDGWNVRPVNPNRVSWDQPVSNSAGLGISIPEDATPKLDGRPVPLATNITGGLLWRPYILIPDSPAGMGPIQAARDALGSAVQVETWGGDVYGNGVPQGILSTDQHIDADTAADNKTRWLNDEDPRVKVLGQGLTYQALKLSPKDAAWLEARQYNAQDVARLYGVPAFMLGLPAGDGMTYGNVQDAWNAYLRLSAMPIGTIIEDALSQLLPDTNGFRFNADALLRPSLDTRAGAAQMLAQAGFSPESIAQLLGFEDLQAKPEPTNPAPAGQAVLEGVQ